MKRLFAVAVGTLSLLLAGCGRGPVKITSPGDGQVFQLPQGGAYSVPQQLVITLDDPDAYEDTTIEIVGRERLPSGLLNCGGGAGTPMICYIGATQMGGFQTQYAVLIRATRGDYQDTKMVFFGQGQTTGGFGAPRATE